MGAQHVYHSRLTDETVGDHSEIERHREKGRCCMLHANEAQSSMLQEMSPIILLCQELTDSPNIAQSELRTLEFRVLFVRCLELPYHGEIKIHIVFVLACVWYFIVACFQPVSCVIYRHVLMDIIVYDCPVIELRNKFSTIFVHISFLSESSQRYFACSRIAMIYGRNRTQLQGRVFYNRSYH